MWFSKYGDGIRTVGGLGAVTELRPTAKAPRSTPSTRSKIFSYFKSSLYTRCSKVNDCFPSYWSHCFVNNKVNSLCLLVCIGYSGKDALPRGMGGGPGEEQAGAF